MDTGPGGFGSAAVTKGILVVTAAASVFIQAASANPRRSKFSRPIFPLSLVPFSTPGELFFGSLLLYYSRIFERHTGSSKYGAYAALVSLTAHVLQLLLRYAGVTTVPTGPYGLLFANFVRYFFDVPASSTFTLFGWRMTDKVFMYVAGVQLLLSNGWSSAAVGLTGIIAGLMYRANLGGIQSLRVPAPVATVFRWLFGWLSDANTPRPPGFNARPSVQGRPGGGIGAHGAAAGAAGATGRVDPLGSAMQGGGASQPPAEAIDQLVAMGFDRSLVVHALQQTGNDVQAAIALLI